MKELPGTGTQTAYNAVRNEALLGVEAERLDPDTDHARIREVVAECARAYQTDAELGRARPIRDLADMVERVNASIVAYGPLTSLFDRRDVEEVFIEGSRVTYIGADGRLEVLEDATSVEENRHVIERLLGDTQRHLDERSPLVQARVLDNTARLTATIPPVAEELSATIRRSTMSRKTLRTMVELGSLTSEAANFLWAAMQTQTSAVLSGMPGSGKSSMLSALMSAIPPTNCIRCCEEIREVNTPITHGSYYEARPPGLDGSGAITLRDLVKFLLSMRPDHIVVGEVRGAEAFELTRAVNAGVGFLTTVHANTAAEALTALVNAAIMAGENVSEPIVRKVFASAVDYVIHLDMDEPHQTGSGSALRRQTMEVLALSPPDLDGAFAYDPIFTRDGLGEPLVWTGRLPPRPDLIDRKMPDGVTVKRLLEGQVTVI